MPLISNHWITFSFTMNRPTLLCGNAMLSSWLSALYMHRRFVTLYETECKEMWIKLFQLHSGVSRTFSEREREGERQIVKNGLPNKKYNKCIKFLNIRSASIPQGAKKEKWIKLCSPAQWCSQDFCGLGGSGSRKVNFRGVLGQKSF